MRPFVSLLCLAFVAMASAETKCGQSQAGRRFPWKIYGGVPAKQGEFPWQISLKSFLGSHQCGGTIISDQWLLTAAHCPNTNNIQLGALDFKHKNGNELTVQVDEWIRHPLNPKNDDYAFLKQYDVALIKIKTKLDFEGEHSHLAPICLGTAEDDAQSPAVASGWGYNEKIQLPSDLQRADLPIVPQDECAEVFKDDLELTERTVCAGAEGIKTTCNGDSGGPLQVQRADGSWAQVGVVSFGQATSQGHCVTGVPAGFARVSFFKEWIEETIANY